jgi:hypothetical protein
MSVCVVACGYQGGVSPAPPLRTNFGKEWVVISCAGGDYHRIVGTRKLVGGSFNFLERGPAIDV